MSYDFTTNARLPQSLVLFLVESVTRSEKQEEVKEPSFWKGTKCNSWLCGEFVVFWSGLDDRRKKKGFANCFGFMSNWI